MSTTCLMNGWVVSKRRSTPIPWPSTARQGRRRARRATAARGIEDEVREGVRVPIGTGFAGRVAASREPIRLERVDATTVTNPILWEKGIKVMLGIPLLSGDQVLGVIHVGRLEHRPFTDDDIALLQVVADRVAGHPKPSHAIERAAAALLERSLLPNDCRVTRAFQFAARYTSPPKVRHRR